MRSKKFRHSKVGNFYRPPHFEGHFWFGTKKIRMQVQISTLQKTKFSQGHGGTVTFFRLFTKKTANF